MRSLRKNQENWFNISNEKIALIDQTTYVVSLTAFHPSRPRAQVPPAQRVLLRRRPQRSLHSKASRLKAVLVQTPSFSSRSRVTRLATHACLLPPAHRKLLSSSRTLGSPPMRHRAQQLLIAVCLRLHHS